MHTSSGKVPVLTIKTERRYGRIVRQPDGSLVRIETTEHVVRYQAMPEDAGDRPFGLGFEQRVVAGGAHAAWRRHRCAGTDTADPGARAAAGPSHTRRQRARTSMTTERARLLVVDDDAELRELAQAYLKQQGFDVETVADGGEMDTALASHAFDLIILDLMLPGEDGLSIAKRLKGQLNVPIIIVSAQGEDVDRIVGLEIGADDYIAKPFNPRELLARIRAVLRRAQNRPAAEPETVTRFGAFELDLNAHRLTRDGKAVPLTSGEFDLLVILVAHPNKVLDRDRLLDLLTGAERSPFDRSIDVRVTRLRGKIEQNPSEPVYIKTIWGKGYMFCPEGA